jgi:hypothetical protein
MRVLAGGAGWRRRDGETAPLTAEQHAAETRWWERNLYRTIHRLAARDPGLAVRAAGAHRLEVLRTDGARLNWFDLDYAGAPVRFGPGDAEDGTVFGPLVAHGPVRVPRWGTNPSGTWRYEIVRFIPSAAPLGADATDP